MCQQLKNYAGMCLSEREVLSLYYKIIMVLGSGMVTHVSIGHSLHALAANIVNSAGGWLSYWQS
jgi:hypothetical protein